MNREDVAAQHHLVDAIEYAVALVDEETLTFTWVNATMAGWTGFGAGDPMVALSRNIREDAVRSRMLRRAPIRFEGLYSENHHHRAVGWSLRQLPGLRSWLLEGRDDTRLRRERAIAQAYVEERLREQSAASTDDAHAYGDDLVEGLVLARGAELRRCAMLPLAVAIRWADAPAGAPLIAAMSEIGLELVARGGHTLIGLLPVASSDPLAVSEALNALAARLASDALRVIGIAAAVNLGPVPDDVVSDTPGETAGALLQLLAASRLGDLVISARLGRHCGCDSSVRLLPYGGLPWTGECGATRSRPRSA
ncbi:MAG: hypothetical protein RIT45_175 [Pseudomonadota bacterium]